MNSAASPLTCTLLLGRPLHVMHRELDGFRESGCELELERPFSPILRREAR